MPVDLSIRNVPDAIATRLRDRAARNHRSVQSEALVLLEQALDDGTSTTACDPDNAVDERRARVAFVRAQLDRIERAPVAESAALIREARDFGYSSDPRD